MVDAPGLYVGVESGWQIASLRYFERAGGFADAVREAVGRPLPEQLRAVQTVRPEDNVQWVLAWRNTSETLLLCQSRIAFAELEQHLAGKADGCMVDQTGGVSVIRMRGPRARELLLRLGASTAIPSLGEALSSRCAEVHVLTACIEEGEFLSLVERVYAAHLLEWIRVTAGDFQ
jgi:sarcosine oxidase gamma subunit